MIHILPFPIKKERELKHTALSLQHNPSQSYLTQRMRKTPAELRTKGTGESGPFLFAGCDGGNV